MKLLIAEDAHDTAEVVAFGARLAWPNCCVQVAATGEEALEYFAAEPADLVILDVVMPPPDGFEVCRRIRERSAVPILVLTARDATLDKVRALELGADDYVTTPFDHLELFARMRALMRRAGMQTGLQRPPYPQHQRVVAGAVEIDLTTREVRVHGKAVALTSTEFRLLDELVRNAGMIVPHRTLMERVWGEAYRDETHYLKVYIRRLRQKLADEGHGEGERPRLIQTEWGSGYRFVVPLDVPLDVPADVAEGVASTLS